MSQKKVRKLTSHDENLLNPLIIIKHEKQTLPINNESLIKYTENNCNNFNC